jgi:hypothetical protein
MAHAPRKPDPNEASASYSGTDQGKDGRREERRDKGVYGADAEEGPGYKREDKQDGGRYGVARTVAKDDDEGSSESGAHSAERKGDKVPDPKEALGVDNRAPQAIRSDKPSRPRT